MLLTELSDGVAQGQSSCFAPRSEAVAIIVKCAGVAQRQSNGFVNRGLEVQILSPALPLNPTDSRTSSPETDRVSGQLCFFGIGENGPEALFGINSGSGVQIPTPVEIQFILNF